MRIFLANLSQAIAETRCASFNSDIYATPYVMKTDSRGEARVKWRLGADVCELMANFGGRIVYFRGESYKDNGDSW